MYFLNCSIFERSRVEAPEKVCESEVQGLTLDGSENFSISPAECLTSLLMNRKPGGKGQEGAKEKTANRTDARSNFQ